MEKSTQGFEMNKNNDNFGLKVLTKEDLMGDFGFEGYFKCGENQKAKNTLTLVKDILIEYDELCQQDLASEIQRKIKQDDIEIVRGYALWRLLDKYNGTLWEITYRPQIKGKKRNFKLENHLRKFKQ